MVYHSLCVENTTISTVHVTEWLNIFKFITWNDENISSEIFLPYKVRESCVSSKRSQIEQGSSELNEHIKVDKVEIHVKLNLPKQVSIREWNINGEKLFEQINK